MSTGMSGTSASAFSSRRLPMKHQGHTTSETTSMRSAAGAPDEAGMTNLRAVVSYQLYQKPAGPRTHPPCAIWVRDSAGRNTADHAGDQCIDTVARLERGERHRRFDAARLPFRQHHCVLEYDCDPAGDHMRG